MSYSKKVLPNLQRTQQIERASHSLNSSLALHDQGSEVQCHHHHPVHLDQNITCLHRHLFHCRPSHSSDTENWGVVLSTADSNGYDFEGTALSTTPVDPRRRYSRSEYLPLRWRSIDHICVDVAKILSIPLHLFHPMHLDHLELGATDLKTTSLSISFSALRTWIHPGQRV